MVTMKVGFLRKSCPPARPPPRYQQGEFDFEDGQYHPIGDGCDLAHVTTTGSADGDIDFKDLLQHG